MARVLLLIATTSYRASDFVNAAYRIGAEVGLDRNRRALDAVTLMPLLMADADTLDLSARVLDQSFDLPFGIAPMGLTGLMWPRSARGGAMFADADGPSQDCIALNRSRR